MPLKKSPLLYNNSHKSKCGLEDVWLLTLSFLALFAFPDIAFAQSDNIGKAVKLSADQIGTLVNIVNIMAYTAGAMMCAGALMKLKKHAESPQNYPMSAALWRLGGAACLMALPWATSFVVETVLGGNASKGGVTGTPGKVTAAVAGEVPGLDVLLQNFVGNIQQPILWLLGVVCYLLGAIMLMQGILAMSKFGQDQKATTNAIMTKMVFAAVLLAAPQAFTAITGSIFGGGNLPTNLVLSYMPNSGDGSSQFNAALGAALNFIQIIGYIAFVRGWFVLRKAIEGDGQASKAGGITHIVGGALAVNIHATLNAVQNTLGVNLVTVT